MTNRTGHTVAHTPQRCQLLASRRVLGFLAYGVIAP